MAVTNDCLCDGKSKLYIKIARDEYENLIQSDDFLKALQAAGVDNWDGYELAQEMMAGD